MKAPFSFCPACRAEAIKFTQQKKLLCDQCGFQYFHNVATAVAAVLRYRDDILFAVRARPPGQHMLDLPGGFCDPGESLEQALRRELNEELGLLITEPRYLFSLPNTYPYRDVVYHTTDAIFEVQLGEQPEIKAADDVAAIRWIKLQDVALQDIAFESVRNAVLRLRGPHAGSADNQ